MSKVEKYAGTISRLNEGKIVKLSDLVKEIAPPPAAPSAPAKTPLPAVITEEQRQALERFTEVFGSVVPTERRALTPDESALLGQERDTVDTVLKMAEARKESIKVTVANHLDVLLEEQGVPKDATKDANGHYVVAQKEPAADGFVWSREVRQGSSNLDPATLKALVDDPDFPEFTHQDYLAMTEQVRVIEENRFMLHLKKNPQLLRAIQQATKSTPSTAAIYVRAAKA